MSAEHSEVDSLDSLERSAEHSEDDSLDRSAEHSEDDSLERSAEHSEVEEEDLQEQVEVEVLEQDSEGSSQTSSV